MKVYGAPLWLAALAVSLGMHLLLALVLQVSLRPEPVKDQEPEGTRLDLASHVVERSQAQERPAESERAAEARGDGQAVGQSAPPRTDARPLQATAPRIAAAAPDGARASEIAPETGSVEALEAAGAKPSAVALPSDRLESATADRTKARPEALPPGQRLATAEPSPQPLATSPVNAPAVTASSARAETAQGIQLPASSAAPALAPAALQLDAARPTASQLETARPTGAPLELAATYGDIAPPLAADASVVAAGQLAEHSERVASRRPRGEKGTAVLAWSGGGDALDPVSATAIAAFLGAGDLRTAPGHSGTVRDEMTDTLTGFDCTRIQAEFVPETGQLRLTGHVPAEADRAPVLAAMQAHVGASIPVADNLRLLPRPQCGALAEIEAVGLPQSSELLTNPRLVGATAQVQEYDYVEGDAFRFDFIGADYDSYIRVDYFDAAGNVIHLVPNDYVPLSLTPAEAELKDVGGPLNITIGPPFGQEIAAAFAVSEPLSDAPRPIVEPAGPYLEWLREQVSEARTRNPDFKGEWVYFFISTAPVAN